MKQQTTAQDKFSKYCEDLIKAAGLNEVKARSGYRTWKLRSAGVKIIFFEYEEEYLFVTAEIATIKKDAEQLYRYVLDKKMAPFLAGMEDDELFLSYRIHSSCLTSQNKKTISKKLEHFLELSVDTKKHIDRHFGSYIK